MFQNTTKLQPPRLITEELRQARARSRPAAALTHDPVSAVRSWRSPSLSATFLNGQLPAPPVRRPQQVLPTPRNSRVRCPCPVSPTT